MLNTVNYYGYTTVQIQKKNKSKYVNHLISIRLCINHIQLTLLFTCSRLQRILTSPVCHFFSLFTEKILDGDRTVVITEQWRQKRYEILQLRDKKRAVFNLTTT